MRSDTVELTDGVISSELTREGVSDCVVEYSGDGVGDGGRKVLST